MKYLKLFEDMNHSDVMAECNDILQELKDNGMYIEMIDQNDVFGKLAYNARLNIIIMNDEDGETPFEYTNIKLNIEHLVSFLDSEGYSLDKIYVYDNDRNIIIESIEDLIYFFSKMFVLELKFV